jgi:hypothetical protein
VIEMIENDEQRQAALSWLRYWKQSLSSGGQSWLAGEQGLEEIMRLHQGVDEYEKRKAAAAV